MRNLRPLLRLDDKVASEGRRLQWIGGPQMRWVAPATLATAVLVHAIALLLPVAHPRADSEAPSLATDFPLVWRPIVDVPPPPPAAAKQPSAPVPGPELDGVPVPATQRPVALPASPVFTARDLAIEPVPEPPPELTLSSISAEVEAIIPNPDPPPPEDDAGPMPESQPGAGLALIEKVSPVYPLAARTLLADGKVTVRLYVLPDGTVSRAIVESCSRRGLGFEAAALRAVKQWRYEPAPLQSGARTVSVTIHFQRQDARP